MDRIQNPNKYINYTPYELRNLNAFNKLGERERLKTMLNFFMQDIIPRNWNHWAEIVWTDTSKPAFIGDMPHTWVGSDYISALRNIIIFEENHDTTITIANGLDLSWFNSNKQFKVNNLYTKFGNVSYSYSLSDKKTTIDFKANLHNKVKFKIKNLIESKPKKVLCNGREISTFDEKYIYIQVDNAKIEIIY